MGQCRCYIWDYREEGASMESDFAIKITGYDWRAAPGPLMEWRAFDFELITDGGKGRMLIPCPSLSSLCGLIEIIQTAF